MRINLTKSTLLETFSDLDFFGRIGKNLGESLPCLRDFLAFFCFTVGYQSWVGFCTGGGRVFQPFNSSPEEYFFVAFY